MTNEEATKIATDHWNGYTKELVRSLLELSIENTEVRYIILNAIKHLCITHFVHGAKHERDSFDEELSKVR